MAVNRERQKVWREKCALGIDYCSLDAAIKTLLDYRAQYGSFARIEKRHHPYGDDEYLALMVQEDETDKEMKARIQKEEQHEAWKAERDRQEYERLLAKFGG